MLCFLYFRILKFTESHYTTPYGIDKLEEKGKQGDIILVEGVRTGSAIVWTKVKDAAFEVRKDSGIAPNKRGYPQNIFLISS